MMFAIIEGAISFLTRDSASLLPWNIYNEEYLVWIILNTKRYVISSVIVTNTYKAHEIEPTHKIQLHQLCIIWEENN